MDFRLTKPRVYIGSSVVASAATLIAAIKPGHALGLLSANYLPHRFCYLAQPFLVWTNVVADGLIALAYGAISACLFLVGKRVFGYPQLQKYSWLPFSFAAFVVSCGVTHFMEVVTVWQPLYPLSAALKILCAAISLPTALLLGAKFPVLLANLEGIVDTLANSASYRAQVEAIDRSQMMIELAMDETVLNVNQNYSRHFGYTPREVIGQRFSLVVTGDDIESGAYQAFWDALRRGQFQTGQYERVTKRGEPIWIEASYNPILDAYGVPLKVVGLLTDVSARVRMERERERQEEALRKSEEFLEETGSLAGVGGWEVDLITGDVQWMPETYRLLGADLSYQPALADALNLYTQESKPVIVAAIERATTDGTGFDLELSLVTVDSRLIWARVVGRARFAGGKPVRLVGAFQDITRRIEERKALQWANQRAELATSSGGIGVWDWNLELNSILCDAQMYRMVHVDPELHREADFAFWAQFVHPEDIGRVGKELQDGIDGIKPYETEYRILLEDGLHFIRATGRVSHDQSNRPVRMVGTNVDITARVAERMALEHANLRAKLATDSGEIGIWEWDLSSGMLVCDDWMFHLFGRPQEAGMPRDFEFWVRRMHPDDRGPVERALRDALEDVRPYNTEFRVVWDDGSIHWIKANGTVDRDLSGTPLRIVGTNFDITGRVMENIALQQAIVRANLATASGGIGIWEWDVPNGTLSCDEQTYLLWGLQPEPGVAHELGFWVARIHPDDQAGVGRALQDGLDNVAPYDFEFRVVWDDGSVHWIDSTGQVERDTTGKPLRMVGTGADVTTRVTEQMALRDANARVALATDSGGIGIWEWDILNNALTWDPWMYRLYGLPQSLEETTSPPYDLWARHVHPDERRATEGALHDAVAGVRPFDTEFRIVWPDSSVHWIKASGQVARDASGQAVRMSGTNFEITQRVIERIALEDANERIALATESSGIGIWEWDILDDRMILDSRSVQLYDLASRAGEPITYRTWVEHLHPEDRAAVEKGLRDSLRGERPFDAEFRIVCDDSRVHYIRATAKVVRDAAGHPIRMLGTNLEITQQKGAEEALRDQASLLDLSHDAIIVRDLAGAIRFWNHGAEEIYGYSKEQALTRTSHQLLQSIFPAPLAEIEQIFMERERWEGDLDHTTQSGKHVFIASRWALKRDKSGRPIGVMEINSDITEQKKAEEALRQSAEKEQLLINGVKDFSIIMLDPQGNVATWNNGAQQINGYELEEILGRHLSVFYTPESTATGKPELVLQVARLKGRFEETGWRVRKDGSSFWANVVTTAMFDNQGQLRGYAAVTRDITKSRLAEEATESARIAADLANRAKSDFLANMSHEVRTPVNAIMGMAHLALRADPQSGQRKYLIKIDTAAKRLLSIMNDILDFSKIEAGKLQLERIHFALNDVMQNLRDMVEEKVREKNLSLSFFVAPDVPAYLSGDPLRLGQVLINLVNNAVKFTDHGEVRVTVERLGGGDSALEPVFVSLLFTVTDTGIGMTAAQIENLFQAFHQADTSFTRQYGGTGLGLAISKQLVELMGGSIGIQSDLGLGSTFSFTVQCGHADGAAIKPLALHHVSTRQSAQAPLVDDRRITRELLPPLETSSLSGRQVLLVEDNDLNRDLATELLADLGIKVSVAVDGQAAVDSVRSQVFDLVLMDIQMPVMDGLTATRTIRSDGHFQQLPIIAMTAHAMTGDRERSLASGMNDHVTKPIDPEVLTRTLLRWMPLTPISFARPETPAPEGPQSPGPIPEHLPPFNIQAALLRTNNKPSLLRKLLLGFKQQYSNAAAELNALLLDGKWAEAQRLVHSLKSIAGTLETSRLAEAAAAVETALRDGRRTGLESLLDDLDLALQPAIAAVAMLDGSTGIFDDPAATGMTVTADSGRRSVILAVDDQPPTLALLSDTFAGDYEVVTAGEGREAIALALLKNPEVVVLDIDMPGMNGFEVCRQLKENPRTREIPVIFLTGLNDAESETSGLMLGAVDYVSKPFNPAVMRVRVQNQFKLKQAQIELVRLLAKRYLDDMVNEVEASLIKARTREIEYKMKEGFLSHVSHELRSPLASIYSFVSIVADRLAGDINPQQDEYLNIALKNIDQLKTMVDNLLEVSRIHAGQFQIAKEQLDMRDVVRAAFDEIQHTADKKHVGLNQSVAEDIGPVVVDPIRVRQVLWILLENAVKFTPAEGMVTVSVTRSSTRSKLVFEVADTGCGISPELIDSIFDKLHQVSPSDSQGRTGLGLGLHIARELVRRQGGDIWVESVLNRGSKFSFAVSIALE